MAGQRQWTSGRFLEEVAGTKIQRELYRPGILFQRRRMGLSGFALAWRLCPELRVQGRLRMGVIRALARAYRKAGSKNRARNRGRHPAGMGGPRLARAGKAE